MSDILSGINEILDDPNAVAKIGEIVNSLGLNGNGNSSSGSENNGNSGQSSNTSSGDLQKNSESSSEDSVPSSSNNITSSSNALSGLLSGLGNINFSSSDRHINLLRAIQPYMRNERSDKINSAIKAISILKTLSNIK